MFTMIKLATGFVISVAIVGWGLSAGEAAVKKACEASNIPHKPVIG